ncbi:uncharacterized protein TNCV_4466671 [Trichonephila clavipes]|nr:uncharacterized protein TNCV_4466671 [Trichonephila clavipes]
MGGDFTFGYCINISKGKAIGKQKRISSLLDKVISHLAAEDVYVDRRLSRFQMLNDDKIVHSVQAESDPVDDETDKDEDINNESSNSLSNAGMFSAMEWCEQQPECCPTQLLLLKRIRGFVTKK